MISIIICSVNGELASQVKQNISATVGIPFEIIILDNNVYKRNINYIYNTGAAKSRYDLLCFVHEDVLFKTPDWGKILTEIFIQNSKIALVGIAGSKYKSKYFSGWYTGIPAMDCANYIHRYTNGEEKVTLSPDNEKLQEVVCIDGVFMCCKKSVWEANPFNENLDGFHFYDIDFSLRIARRHTIAVTYGIDLIHITTGGDYGNSWMKMAIQYHQMYAQSLPYSRSMHEDNSAADTSVIKATIDVLKNHKISIKNKLMWVSLQQLYKIPKVYYSVLKLFLYRPLHLKRLHNFFK